ncbi:MAG: hypothetical protein ACMVY4_11370 [Minwuia sp.]|uniref:hypothetical protein n=1 Tax=Minwuia sp. TaxID=2493630 RepID=UPI003A8AC08B
MRTITTGLIAAAAIFSICSAASAQMLCKERAQVLDKLSNNYKEAPVAMGIASNGAVLEVLTSSEGAQTWTILITQPNGISCVMATGEDWTDVERVALTTDPVS